MVEETKGAVEDFKAKAKELIKASQFKKALEHANVSY